MFLLVLGGRANGVFDQVGWLSYRRSLVALVRPFPYLLSSPSLLSSFSSVTFFLLLPLLLLLHHHLRLSREEQLHDMNVEKFAEALEAFVEAEKAKRALENKKVKGKEKEAPVP